jgi:DNA-binding transcriptional ArsR family regulator
MRPITHPAIADITVEGILYALSDPVRVEIFMSMAAADCAKPCSAYGEVKNRKLPKSSLSQHIKILREAGLIRSQRQGVEIRNTTRCTELADKFGDLISGIVNAYQRQNSAKKKSKRS